MWEQHILYITELSALARSYDSHITTEPTYYAILYKLLQQLLIWIYLCLFMFGSNIFYYNAIDNNTIYMVNQNYEEILLYILKLSNWQTYRVFGIM